MIASLRSAQGWALAIALAALPFELARGLAFGPLTLTNVELLLLGAAGLWLAGCLAERRRPMVPAWLLLGGGALIGALLLSAALAPAWRAEALKFALRQGQGLLLACCVADLLGREGAPLARRLGGALLAGATLSALLGLWELSEAPAAMAVLAPFKTESTFVGGLLRLSATFSYANTAAQYYEALLPLAALAALPPLSRWRSQRERGQGVMAMLLLCLPAPLILATLFSYSRAALLVSGALLALIPPAVWWAGGRHLSGDGGWIPVRSAALVCAALAALVAGAAALSPELRLRLVEPDVARWFGARYAAGPVGALQPNALLTVPITVENSGRIAWEPDGLRPIRLAYHWVDAETGAVVRFNGRRTLLPRAVRPGESITLQATVQAPERPGRYRLVWDMLREYIGRGWFSQMGVAPAEVPVVVAGVIQPGAPPPPAAEPPTTPRALGAQPGPPARRALWGAALALWAERPLLGIGPDAFRRVYGPRLGLERWDDRVHTNNLYLELLVGAGLLGLAAFGGLGIGLARAVLRAGRLTGVRGAPDRCAGGATCQVSEQWLLLGAALGLAAALAHGALDVFLAFTPTYGLLWALAGAVAGLSAKSLDSLRARAS